ncbi:MAG: hypothetical protein Kow0059_15210 [Candidatus Sumerlaeia bacterium]
MLELLRGLDLFTANLVLSGLLFSVGTIGLLFKRNAISVFMFVELMLNAVNLTFVAFAVERVSQGALMDAAAIVLFVITIAAAEAGVGLALFVSIYQARRNVNVDELAGMGEAVGEQGGPESGEAAETPGRELVEAR